jgi:asparagine synthase (glutamine-hydrolysing)
MRSVAEAGAANPESLPAAEAEDQLDGLLRSSVGMRMVADVPLGAFLSGGVDSSTVVALMQAQSTRPVRTFSIGFAESGYDEAQDAKRVAAHLGTDHTELYVTPHEARAVIPRIPTLYDEPFADSSQIPTLLVSELARRHVTVSLSGDGGDELFGGYDRYFLLQNVWRRIGRAPRWGRVGVAAAMTSLSPAAWDRAIGWAGPLLPARARIPRFGDRVHKLAGMVGHGSPGALYHDVASLWKDPASVVIGGREPPTPLTDPNVVAVDDVVARAMYLDTVTYLPDDILAKVDRASMGVSLEARVPMLDHRVVEWAWRLPMDLKVRDGQGKWLLRRVLDRYVPRHLVERPKMGFGVPVGEWLRGPLRPWAEELLAERRLRDGGYFGPAPVRALWAEHLEGSRSWAYHLWGVLMFEAWLVEQ